MFDTSVGGVWNVWQVGLASYCASKGAVIQLTRAMALDLIRHRIRVNALDAAVV